MPSMNGGHSPLLMLDVLTLNFLHHSCTVLKAELVCCPHLIGGGIAHTVKNFVENIYLLHAQRIFKWDTELVKLVRKLSGVNTACTEVVNHINHRYMSFQIQYYRKRLH